MPNDRSHPHTNRLIHETSPYLLQHAHNPVDWYPWGAEALAKARTEDKPILLSVGYSACHWCHVMEQESFEDEEVARVMNARFVCIKVDREERPDLDKIYQLAHQLLAQRPGGWPLNMFLSAEDQTPFFGGTYFPKTPRHGMPAFTDILTRVADFYRDHRDELRTQNDSVRAAFASLNPGAAPAGLTIQPNILATARKELEAQFDPAFGGFGQAPKFPHPTTLERLLRQWAHTPSDARALEMARFTLKAMAAGGLFDQLSGGFFRYSVDERWLIPHFEKMLYDNGPLLALYTDAFVATGEPEFEHTVAATGEFLMREMQAPEGGYYATLDADSEGHEGKFYVWTPDTAHALLTDAEWRVAAPYYGLEQKPNFEREYWHLYVAKGLRPLAQSLQESSETCAALLDSARAKLFAGRETRVRPGRDEKVLTAWNGLAIKGMARAGRFLKRDDFVDSAARALDFIRAHLWRDERLLATYKDGRARLNAYLDDYAFLIDGILELSQARWRDGDIEFAMELADVLLDRFEDQANGAFYFTADDHERLVYRPKPTGDEATPSGNGIAAMVLLRLGHVLGQADYLQAAERCLTALYATAARFPSAHNALLNAMEEFLYPTQTIVLRGEAAATAPWRELADAHFAPRRLVFAIPPTAALPSGLAARVPRGDVTAYVCEGHACQAPVDTLAAFEAALGV